MASYNLRRQSPQSNASGTSCTIASTAGMPGRLLPASRPTKSTRTSRSSTIWDSYDYRWDGNFDEPDGYIDTFQSVHAGEGEEAGAEPWTIWSHSWYVPYDLIGRRRARLQQVRRHPHRRQQLLGRQVHGSAGKWRRWRVRTRVRPRPRPARPVRHRGRRQWHRVLDPDVVRLLAQRRQGRHRLEAQPHGRVGKVAARLAELRCCACRQDLLASSWARP